VLIRFEYLKDVYTSIELAKVINNMFSKYKLQGRVTLITTDNTSNNRIMITEINEILTEALDAGQILDSQV
jgi:nicotinamide mononucleotide adenylyltransferase